MTFFQRPEVTKECQICKSPKILSNSLKICKDCVKKGSSVVEEQISLTHKISRQRFNLPTSSPHSDLVKCSYCFHRCGMDESEKSYCGLRSVKNKQLVSLANRESGILEYYLDPLPCNCCAAWFCPAGTGSGFPEFAYKEGEERGFYNLSVFFYGCSFDCLFCQNYHHKSVKAGRKVSSAELSNVYKNNKKISCVCFFGGSPEPHFPFALNVSKEILQIAEKEKRIARICWEWNGSGNPNLVRKAAEYSLKSGGNIKFDLKAWNPSIHKALTGVSNKRTLENFEMIGKEYFGKRRNIPVLNATTLLVPGYIDEEEVENIASFIASIDENIPYSLLGFHPQHEFNDLPFTSRELAESCQKTALKYLKNVNVGNKHILF